MRGAAEAAQRYHQCWSLPQGAVASAPHKQPEDAALADQPTKIAVLVCCASSSDIVCTLTGLVLPAKNWRLQHDTQMISPQLMKHISVGRFAYTATLVPTS